ncbi:MAG: tetratricopeptide repeat protein [Asticcacaulis sp.]
MPEASNTPLHALLRQPPKPAAPAFAPQAPATEALPYAPPKIMNPASQILGDAGSAMALRLLAEQTERLKRVDTLVLLKEALVRFKMGDWQGGGECALSALHIDEKCGETWHILGIARDKVGDTATALTCYETALRLMPDDVAIANDLGRLALRMGQAEMAEKFFRYFLARCPGHVEAVNNLATTLREASRYEEAIDLLKATIQDNQTDPQLWNALGTVVNAQGDMATATIFYAEALKYDPDNVHAMYNYGNAIAVVGDTREGLTWLLRGVAAVHRRHERPYLQAQHRLLLPDPRRLRTGLGMVRSTDQGRHQRAHDLPDPAPALGKRPADQGAAPFRFGRTGLGRRNHVRLHPAGVAGGNRPRGPSHHRRRAAPGAAVPEGLPDRHGRTPPHHPAQGQRGAAVPRCHRLERLRRLGDHGRFPGALPP